MILDNYWEASKNDQFSSLFFVFDIFMILTVVYKYLFFNYKQVSKDDLLAAADPLGFFPEMIQIVVFDKDDYSELYQEVLIDTPVGPYFMRFLESCMHGLSENFTLNDVQNLFKEMRPENIRTSLKKVTNNINI